MTSTKLLQPRLFAAAAMSGLTVLGAAGAAHADGPKFEVFGFAMLDYIQDFKRVNPAWDATLRPSRIPTVDGQFGSDGQSILSARQSRFGVTATQDIAGKPLEVKFDFDLFGVGDNEGQTTFRLQNFYGKWGPILAGQTNTLFMDGDIFPNTLDYWGPAGMVYLRNPQIRYTYKSGAHEWAIAIEQPNNDVDPGNIRLIRPGLGIQGDEKIPDLTSHYRYDGDWGHVQLAGILRQVGFDTANTPDNEPHGHKTGWGFDLTSNVKVGKKDVLHLGVVYGEGIASYMNDGGTDLAPSANVNSIPLTPVVNPLAVPNLLNLSPEVVPLTGVTIYYDHFWNDQWSSSIGYSQTHVDNTNFQEPSAFKTGEYASVNLLYTPDKRLLVGGEFLWGRREDKNGASGDDTRLQFSFKYSFSSSDFK
jgi:hypothetical protein